VCAPFTEANLGKLLSALQGLGARFGEPRALPLPSGPNDLVGYTNLYLTTDEGKLDVLSEVTGIGGFDAVRARSIDLTLFGVKVRSLDLDAIIEAKRAMLRDKDRLDLRELELIRAKRRKP
jgi:hypothetical protein